MSFLVVDADDFKRPPAVPQKPETSNMMDVEENNSFNFRMNVQSILKHLENLRAQRNNIDRSLQDTQQMLKVLCNHEKILMNTFMLAQNGRDVGCSLEELSFAIKLVQQELEQQVDVINQISNKGNNNMNTAQFEPAVYYINPSEIVRTQALGLDEDGRPRNTQSTVFAGKYYDLDVCIKEVHKRKDHHLDNLKHEVKLAREITHHPNMCNFLGAYVEPNKAILVTELCKGGDLGDFIRKSDANVDMFRKLKIARDICTGMAWLHLHGVMHNDLKPDNVLFDENGTAKITDFGFSRTFTGIIGIDIEQNDRLTNYGGSALYMAPERLSFQKPTPASDVYSFAIILWEILTRQVPFQSYIDMRLSSGDTRTVREIFAEAVCKGERPLIPQRYRGSRIERILTESWHPDPLARPTFLKLIDEINSLLVETAITDELGRHLWKSQFVVQPVDLNGTRTVTTVLFEVPVDQFMTSFRKVLGIEMASATIFINPAVKALTDTSLDRHIMQASVDLLKQTFIKPTTSLELKQRIEKERQRRLLIYKLNCLKDLIGTKKGNETVISLVRFGKMLSFFGPLRSDQDRDFVGSTFLNKVRNLMEKKYLVVISKLIMNRWFRGDMSNEECFNCLRSASVGSYILRFSPRRNALVLSVVRLIGQGNKKEVVHIIVQYTPGQGFSVPGSAVYPSIEDLVNREKSLFGSPCEESPVTAMVDDDGWVNLSDSQQGPYVDEAS